MAKIHLDEAGSMIFTPVCSRGHRMLTFDLKGYDGKEDFYLDKMGRLFEMGEDRDMPTRLFGVFVVMGMCPVCGEPYSCELAFNVGFLQRVSRLLDSWQEDDTVRQPVIRLRAAP